MKLEITRPTALALDMIVFVAEKYDDGVRYKVIYGGVGDEEARKHNGVLIGYVARNGSSGREWLATPDQGDEAGLRWYSGFTTRPQAALFLLGARVEQDVPAVLRTHAQHRLLRDHPARTVDESLPASRRCEVAFRRAVPERVGEFEILHVHLWSPGSVGAYATATVVTRRGADGDFCVHTLCWADDDPDYPWYVVEGHYDLPTFERAHQKAALIAARQR